MAGADDVKTIPRLSEDAKADLEQTSGDQDTAQREAQQLGRNADKRDLAREANEADHDRSEFFRNSFERLVVQLVVFVAWGFMGLALLWGTNIMLGRYAWLTEEQMRDLQGILTGGLILGLVGDHVKRRTALNPLA